MGASGLRRPGCPHGTQAVQDQDGAGEGRREAEKALAAFVTELETSGVASGGTFGELVERWIVTAVPDWSPANEVTVRNTVSYHLGPYAWSAGSASTGPPLSPPLHTASRRRGPPIGRPSCTSSPPPLTSPRRRPPRSPSASGAGATGFPPPLGDDSMPMPSPTASALTSSPCGCGCLRISREATLVDQGPYMRAARCVRPVRREWYRT